jgi:hypothetical protein
MMGTKLTHIELVVSVCVSFRLSSYFNCITAGRILIKFDVNIIPLKSTPRAFLIISCN